MRSGRGRFVHGDGQVEEGIWKDGEMAPSDKSNGGGVVRIQKDVLIDPNTTP